MVHVAANKAPPKPAIIATANLLNLTKKNPPALDRMKSKAKKTH